MVYRLNPSVVIGQVLTIVFNPLCKLSGSIVVAESLIVVFPIYCIDFLFVRFIG